MKMALNLKSLGQLDSGHAEAVINDALRKIIEDADDRGDDGKARKAVITVSVEKADSGYLVFRVEATTVMPKQSTGGTMAKVIRNGTKVSAEFEELAPDNPDQGTIDYPEMRKPHPEA